METARPSQIETSGVVAPAPTELKERPKLQLQPRTLPVEEVGAPIPAASSSIFGAAKPVNTAAREREIEERLKEKQLPKENTPNQSLLILNYSFKFFFL